MSTDDYGFNLAADYEALGDELIPKYLDNGKYIFEVTRAVPGQTSGGKPKLAVHLKVLEGEEAGHEDVENLTWSPESKVARGIFSRALAVMGADVEWVKLEKPTFTEIADRITGAIVECSVKYDAAGFNGQPQNRYNFLRNMGTAAEQQNAPQVAQLGVVTPPAAEPQQSFQATPQAQQQAAQTASAWPTT